MKKNLLLTLVALLCVVHAQAYDYFRSEGICYVITSETTIKVTKLGFNGEKYSGTIIIPAEVSYSGIRYSVTSIGAYAFNGCKGLTSVTIPNSVTSIENYAFSGCRGLTSVTIGSSVTTIGEYAFSDCTGLTSVTIPNSVTSIGDDAFSHCTGLTSITIGNGVTSIGDYAFRGCTALSSVVWNAKKCVAVPFYSKKITSFTFGDKVESIPNGLCSGMEKLTSITIPNSVTSIGVWAFFGCTSLTSVTIGNGVTSIGSEAFRDCTGLKKVNYTGDVKGWISISMGIFSDSNPIYYSKNLYLNDVLLTDLILPEGITTMPNAFAYDTCLTSVTIPNSVTSIGEDAFVGCTGLTSITIPNSVTSIDRWAFRGCGGLTSIVVESGNPVYDNRNNCNAIIVTSTNTLMLGCNTTVIPKSVTSIGVFAFKGCSSLTSITVPESVTSIGNLAFEGCTGLESINVRAERPPFIYSDTFKDIPTYTPVYIPCGTKETYQLASEWQKFTNFIESLGITLTLTSQDAQMGSVRFTKKGASCTENESVFEAIANEGYIFTHWSDGNTDNPRHLVLTQDTIIVAQFRGIRSYAVNVDCNPEQGSVSGSGVYTETAPVTLTATENTGYRFSQWSDGNTDNPRTLTLTSDTTLTAEFVVASFMVTATALHGSVTGTGYYSYGDEAVLTVNTEVGYRFTQWGDGNTDNPRTIIVIQDTSLTAQCEAVNHTITVTCNPQQGNVIGGGTYADGAQVTLAAIANKGYEFAQWSNGVTDNPYMLTATADITLEAQFIPATAVDNVSADGTTPQKIVRDGQVYILRNGKTYTTTGVEIK